MNALLPMVP